MKLINVLATLSVATIIASCGTTKLTADNGSIAGGLKETKKQQVAATIKIYN